MPGQNEVWRSFSVDPKYNDVKHGDPCVYDVMYIQRLMHRVTRDYSYTECSHL